MPDCSNKYRLLISALVAALLTACSGHPPSRYAEAAEAHRATRQNTTPQYSSAPASLGYQIAGSALGQVGVPYQYGGKTPDGFDCSGLVWFTYKQYGINVPRTSRDQYRASKPLKLNSVEPGDLLFFDIGGRISHVGIYLGDGKFVHAPKAGTQVTVNNISDPFYRKHFERAGRLAN